MDDDEHFCLSLVEHLHDLEPRYKTMAEVQITKVFNDIEWMRATQLHTQTATGFGYITLNQNQYG